MHACLCPLVQSSFWHSGLQYRAVLHCTHVFKRTSVVLHIMHILYQLSHSFRFRAISIPGLSAMKMFPKFAGSSTWCIQVGNCSTSGDFLPNVQTSTYLRASPVNMSISYSVKTTTRVFGLYIFMHCGSSGEDAMILAIRSGSESIMLSSTNTLLTEHRVANLSALLALRGAPLRCFAAMRPNVTNATI